MEIFAHEFFQRAFLGGMLIGLAAPLLGLFLVLRRLAMIGDSLAHVSIAGVALGLLVNIYPLGVGLGFAILASLAIEKLRKAYKSYAELSIAIIMSGGIALATFLFTLGKGFSINVQSYLFGSIYTLSWLDLAVVFTVAAAVVAVLVIFFKELFLMTFDEDAASVSGLPLSFLNTLLTVLTALVIGVAIKIVGALLVSALLTIPVACSLMVGRSFRHTAIIAVMYSEIAVAVGLISAGLWNLAPGATIVLTLIGLLLLSLTGRRLLQ
jgi:zinc transport system permease protein